MDMKVVFRQWFINFSIKTVYLVMLILQGLVFLEVNGG